MNNEQKRMIQKAKALSEGKENIIKRINEIEQESSRRWFHMLTMPDGAGRDSVERDVDALDAQALGIIWTVMQMGYDVERDGIGTVTDIVSR